MLPANAPDRLSDRSTLWNEVEAGEKLPNSQIARDVEFALQPELSDTDNIDLARSLVQEMWVDRGMIADINVHRGAELEGGGQKIHCHVLLTMRTVGSEGFGRKQRSWNDKALVQEWRELLARRTNEKLAERGVEARIDHRSYAERGIKLEPRSYEPGGHNLAGQAEIAGRNGNRIITDPLVALEALTSNYATFTWQDLMRFVDRHTVGNDQFQLVKARIEASPELVRLGPDAKGQDRYSTRDMVAAERSLVDHAASLARVDRHMLDRSAVQAALADQDLGPEQRTVLAKLVEPKGLVLVTGYAGTGKSRLLGTAAEAWDLAGYRVRGAALSGIAAQGLETGSGIESRTIASWEHAWERGFDKLERNEVLVVDEAGMAGTKQLERLLAAADKVDCKVVLVGDPEQLQSIAAGAAFKALVARHGAAELTIIRRQRSKWQQEATREFATMRTADALARYGQAGMVREAATVDIARDDLVEMWDRDRTAQPGRSHLILAYTRDDVAKLNELARERMRAAGKLGVDTKVATERGRRMMAVGDRIMFLKNDRVMGVKNGTLGEIRSMKNGQLEVQLDDGAKLGGGNVVRFYASDYASLDHGYASTIHKSQGVTVGRSYVLATSQFDRHTTYVAMTRHTGRATLFYGRDDFRSETQLAAKLSRERTKDNAMDYPEVVQSMAAERQRPEPINRLLEAVAKLAKGREHNTGRDGR